MADGFGYSMGTPQSVMVSLELDIELVEWLDQYKEQLGIRSRGFLINQLLRELAGLNSADDEPSEPADCK